MSKYTPTTDEVFETVFNVWCMSMSQQEAVRAFYRWLNSVKAEAWDTGHEAFEEAWRSDHLFPYDYATENPYRTGGAE